MTSSATDAAKFDPERFDVGKTDKAVRDALRQRRKG